MAIVKKIMEEHGGFLEMHEADNGGTVVRLVFPATSLAEDDPAAEDQHDESGDAPKTMVS